MTVYFVQPGNDPFVKIGYSSGDVSASRLCGLQIGHPKELKILAQMPGTMRDEATLHLLFQKHYVRGEWFHLNDEVATVIKKIGSGRFRLPPYEKLRGRFDRARKRRRTKAEMIASDARRGTAPKDRMPLEEVMVFWFDKLLRNKQVMERVNGDRRYKDSWSYTVLWRLLGDRFTIKGRPAKAK